MPAKKKHDQQELQTKYIQLQLLKQQLKEMIETRNTLVERMKELLVSTDALEKLGGVKKGEEIWSSIGSSAFVKSDIKDTENVLVGVGSGIVIKETRPKAIEILQARIGELKKIDQELISELTKFAQAIEMLEPQVEQLMHEQQEE